MAITLYRYPGPYPMHGDHFDYITCEPPTVEARIQEGWFHSPTDAKAAAEKAANTPPAKTLSAKVMERIGVAEKLRS